MVGVVLLVLVIVILFVVVVVLLLLVRMRPRNLRKKKFLKTDVQTAIEEKRRKSSQKWRGKRKTGKEEENYEIKSERRNVKENIMERFKKMPQKCDTGFFF